MPVRGSRRFAGALAPLLVMLPPATSTTAPDEGTIEWDAAPFEVAATWTWTWETSQGYEASARLDVGRIGPGDDAPDLFTDAGVDPGPELFGICDGFNLQTDAVVPALLQMANTTEGFDWELSNSLYGLNDDDEESQLVVLTTFSDIPKCLEISFFEAWGVVWPVPAAPGDSRRASAYLLIRDFYTPRHPTGNAQMLSRVGFQFHEWRDDEARLSSFEGPNTSPDPETGEPRIRLTAALDLPDTEPPQSSEIVTESTEVGDDTTATTVENSSPTDVGGTTTGRPCQFEETTSLPLKRCDMGPAVAVVQSILQAEGYDVAIDGEFGDQMLYAVRAFQEAEGLEIDGVVDLETWAALGIGEQFGTDANGDGIITPDELDLTQ